MTETEILHVAVKLAQTTAVAPSFLTFQPGAVDSHLDAKVFAGLAFQYKPVSSML